MLFWYLVYHTEEEKAFLWNGAYCTEGRTTVVYLSLQTVEFSSTLHFRIVQQRIDCANVRFITAYILDVAM